MFKNLLIAMDLSPASICLLGCMAEAFLGRVANHVVHRSTIPVLVVPGRP